MDCYRIWLKSTGGYQTAVANNRYQAVAIAIKEKGVDPNDIKAVGKATQYGRLYDYATMVVMRAVGNINRRRD